jgi:probable rRNA maturation factor
MPISIVRETRNPWLLPLGQRELKRALRLMLKALDPVSPAGRVEAMLELALLDDPGMAELNRRCLGLDGPTNVLAFPEPGRPPGYLALSVEAVAREAFLYRRDPLLYGLELIAHGLGHLLGRVHGEDMYARTELAARSAYEQLQARGFCRA